MFEIKIEEIPPVLITGLIVLGLALLMLGMSFKEAQAGMNEYFKNPALVKIEGNAPKIIFSQSDGYKYTVTLKNMNLKYVGERYETEIDAEGNKNKIPISKLEIVPIIGFKGKYAKVKTISGNPQFKGSTYFWLSRESDFKDKMDFEFDVSSKIPPIRKLDYYQFGSENSGQCIKEGQTYLFRYPINKRNKEYAYYIISLESMRKRIFGNCYATFRVQCKNGFAPLINMKSYRLCEKEGSYSECDKYISCDGTIRIKLFEADCKRKRANVFIDIVGSPKGIIIKKKEDSNIGERVNLLLFRINQKTDCNAQYFSRDEFDINDLMHKCKNDFLASKIFFTEPVAEGPSSC